MRIEAYSQIQNLYQPRKSSGSAPAKAPSDFRDSLMISGAGRELQTARDAVAAASDVREDKISALKDAYSQGTYNVSSAAFAEKIASRFYEEV